MIDAARESSLKMVSAHIDENSQATCIWEASEKSEVETLFSNAGVTYQSIVEVEEYQQA